MSTGNILILQSLEVSFSTAHCHSKEKKKDFSIVVWALEANRLLVQENLRP